MKPEHLEPLKHKLILARRFISFQSQNSYSCVREDPRLIINCSLPKLASTLISNYFYLRPILKPHYFQLSFQTPSLVETLKMK